MRLYLLVSVASMAVGMFLATKIMKPEAVVTEKVVTKDRIITKTVTVTAKDGSSTSTTESVQDRQSEASKAILAKKDYFVSAYVTNSKSEYGIAVQRRIVGDIYAYGAVETGGKLAIGIGVAF